MSAALLMHASAFDPAMAKLKELTSTTVGVSNKTNHPPTMDLIDNSINSDAYFVGGGDVFTIHIVELPSVEYTAIMDQNCDAEIPDLGVIRIGRKTLTDAKKLITDFVTQRMNKRYQVYVALSRAKSALVTVTGAVTNPGTYQVEGTSRVLDVIRFGNANVIPNMNDYNYREVTVVNKDTAAAYDLFKFLYCNNNLQNPYVYPGDNICLALASKRCTLRVACGICFWDIYR